MTVSTSFSTALAAISQITEYSELRALQDALSMKSRGLASLMKYSFKRGQKVTWVSPRNNVTQAGTIEKINRKYIVVATPAGRWNVSPTLLKAA